MPKKKLKKRVVNKTLKVKPVIIDIPIINISDTALPKKPRKKRGVNETRMYFTQDTEDAIVKYNNEENTY